MAEKVSLLGQIDQWYGVLNNGIKDPNSGQVRRVTLEQLEKHEKTGPRVAEMRVALANDRDYNYPLIMASCLQGKRDPQIMVPLITEPEGDRRKFRFELLEDIREVAKVVSIPQGQQIYDHAWTLKMCDKAEGFAGAENGVVSLQGETLEEMQVSFKKNSSLAQRIYRLRRWATPRDRNRTQTSEKPETPPEDNEGGGGDDFDPLSTL